MCMVSRAVTGAVQESNIVECFKQSSTWPIDPNIVLNKIPSSALIARVTFEEYTAKQIAPDRPPSAQTPSLNPIEIALSPQTPARPTKSRRPDSDPSCNRESNQLYKLYKTETLSSLTWVQPLTMKQNALQ